MNQTTTKPALPYELRVFHSFEEAERHQPEWDDLVLKSGTDIYLTFDWCRLWWKYYGTKRDLHLLLFFSGEQAMGIVPAFIETLWLGPVCMRVAKLVGADFSLQLCNLPVFQTSLAQVTTRVISYFLGDHHCDLLLFGPLSGTAAHLEEHLAAGQNEPTHIRKTEVTGHYGNTYFPLPDTFSKYLSSIGSHQRNNLNHSLSQLSRVSRVTYDVVSGTDECLSEFERFRSLHHAQWKSEGKMGHFGDWPDSEAFNLDLIRTLGQHGRVRFYRILANRKVISSQFCFVFGGTTYWRLPARVCGPEWDGLGLGKIGLVKMIESAIGEGQHLIEGGRGYYPYKALYGGQQSPLRTVQFTRHGLGVSCRENSFRKIAALLNLSYYRLYFMRIAPRIPKLQQPLWPAWIRSTW